MDNRSKTIGIKHILQKSFINLNFEDIANFDERVPDGNGNQNIRRLKY